MEFNEEQLAAIQTSGRNVLVLAGAGTGKTRTIIGRARHLLSSGTPPERLAILTFTRRAASEIGERLRGATADVSGVFAGTFHRFCLRTMSSRRKWFDFNDLTVMDRDDQIQLMKLARGEIAGKNKTVPQAAELLSKYSYARNTNQPPKDYLESYTDLTPSEINVVTKVFARYKERKAAGGYFDYDDILHRFALVLRNDAEVRRRIGAGLDYVLVDEMQDTNPLQWLILESLAEHAKLFCVGDDAQSIYAFRGADFKNVHTFGRRLPDAETLKLTMNYRSTQPVLDVSNWLLSASSLKYNKRLQATRGGGAKPTFVDFDTNFEEAEWVVGDIADRYQEGTRWEANMILCRTAAASRPFEAQLIERKIPYRFVGGIGLLQTAHVRDLLAPLRIVINHRDELAWMRYLTAWPRIGEVTATRILRDCVAADSSGLSFEIAKEKLAGWPDAYELLERIGALGSNPAACVEIAAERMEHLLESKYDSWDRRKKDFTLLEELAKRHKTLQGFVETYTLDPVNATELEEQDDLVTLITVHSAKGTESDVCYVVAAHSQNYPHSRSQGDEDAVEEERRVLYVALTRAKDELFITRSPAQFSYRRAFVGGYEEYFLQDLPSDLVIHKFESGYSPRRSYLDEDVIR